VTICLGILVIGNKFIGQTQVEYCCAPWMATFESGGIETLHVGDGGVTFWGCFSFNSKLDLHVNDVACDDNVLKNE